jgi:hypothetical protein
LGRDTCGIKEDISSNRENPKLAEVGIDNCQPSENSGISPRKSSHPIRLALFRFVLAVSFPGSVSAQPLCQPHSHHSGALILYLPFNRTESTLEHAGLEAVNVAALGMR